MKEEVGRRIISLWRFVTFDKRSLVGLAVILSFVLLGVFADRITSSNPGELFKIFQTPSSLHLMGTDQFGRDVFTMSIHGIRVSLMFGFGAATISLIVGTILGSIAGYYGGLLDHLLSRFSEVFLMIPGLLLVILATSLFGTNINITMICVGLTIWPANARIMRVQVLSIKSREYIKSTVLIGASDLRVIVKHILPNAIAAVIANTTTLVGTAILTEAALSFLGLGDLNNPSWGQIIHYAPMYPWAWWLSLSPGLFIIITVFAFNLLGEGLNVAISPNLRSA